MALVVVAAALMPPQQALAATAASPVVVLEVAARPSQAEMQAQAAQEAMALSS